MVGIYGDVVAHHCGVDSMDDIVDIEFSVILNLTSKMLEARNNAQSKIDGQMNTD